MKASELRQGNWVGYYGGSCQGKILGMKFSKFSGNNNIQVSIEPPYASGWALTELEDLTPIPLTEEWLIKLGFENWGQKTCNEYEKYDRWVLHNVVNGTSNFEVHIIYSHYGSDFHKEICFSIDSNERQYIHNTEFVHNLQNAFYLCTDNELKINRQQTDK